MKTIHALRTFSLASALVLVAGAASGQGGAPTPAPKPPCQTSDTLQQCWERYQPPPKTDAAVAASATAAGNSQLMDLRSVPTGLDTAGFSLGSLTQDFLPLLSLAGVLGDSSQEGSDGTLVMNLNFLVPGLAKDRNAQLQLLVDNQPQVSGAVQAALPEATRDAAVAALEKDLGDLSDYGLQLSYSWMSSRTGRGFEQYRNRFAALYRAVALQGVPADGEVDPLRAFGDFLDAHQQELAVIPEDFEGSTFQQIGQALAPGGTSPGAGAPAAELQARQVMQLFEQAVSRSTAQLESDRQRVTAAGLDRFSSLVNNQPELALSLLRRQRDPLVGGDETSLSMSYSWSAANLNNAMSRPCQQDMNRPLARTIPRDTLENCLAEYTSFVSAQSLDIAQGDRFSVAAEYVDVADQRVEVPSQNLDLTVPGSNKLIASLGWSRLWNVGTEPLRLDLVASYENVSDDPMRKDRGLATLTITRRFGNLSIPFGIVYATRGEFLPQTDERLSAHVGIKFSLFSQLKNQLSGGAPAAP